MTVSLVADDAHTRRDIRACLMPGFIGFTAPEWILSELHDGLVSICVYGGNVRDATQLRTLGQQLRRAAPEALIAIDEEGGEVTRLHYREGSPYPGAAVMGRIDDVDYTEEIGARVARDMLSSGFNLALGPVADVNSNPENPVIGTRSFGAEPGRAGRHVAAWVRGLEGAGAVACPKHFPGHGDTSQDSHLALPTVDAAPEIIAARDLPPFDAAFAAGARTVMTSHILLPQLDPSGPATFSRVILGEILRGRLGFTGITISDALDMQGASAGIGIPEAAVRAFAAGCELLCLGTEHTRDSLREIEDRVLAAIHEGRLSAEHLRASADRVRALARDAVPRSMSTVHPARAERPERVGAGAGAASPEPGPDAAEIATIIASFDGIEEARTWLRAHRDAAVVRVESEASMAVGLAPWGPFAVAAHTALAQPGAAEHFAARPMLTVDESTPQPWCAAAIDAHPAIVIGRDLHRHRFARDGIDALRASGTPVLVVETGWPGTDPGYADLKCFGSTALVGAALLSLFLEGTHDSA